MSTLIEQIFHTTKHVVHPNDINDWFERVVRETRSYHRGFNIRQAAKIMDVINKEDKPKEELFKEAQKHIEIDKDAEYFSILEITARFSTRGIEFFEYTEPQKANTPKMQKMFEDIKKVHIEKNITNPYSGPNNGPSM